MTDNLIRNLRDLAAFAHADLSVADEAADEIERLREALTDIGVYGCGMLNQPAALNGSNEAWLEKRIHEYERVACAALGKNK